MILYNKVSNTRKINITKFEFISMVTKSKQRHPKSYLIIFIIFNISSEKYNLNFNFEVKTVVT